MLIVESQISSQEDEQLFTENSRSSNVDEFEWSDGLTPPLKNVRKRRFRKRISAKVKKVFGYIRKPFWIEYNLCYGMRDRLTLHSTNKKNLRLQFKENSKKRMFTFKILNSK